MGGATTCRQCGLKFFAKPDEACPRCRAPLSSEGSAPLVVPLPASTHGDIPVAVVDEARSRLLVWNDEPKDVVARVVRHGVAFEQAEALVGTLAKEVRAKLAPGARFSGAVHLFVGVPLALLGAGVLYFYFSARSGGGWIPNRFTGSMLVGGIVMSAAGTITTLRGLARLISGSTPPE